MSSTKNMQKNSRNKLILGVLIIIISLFVIFKLGFSKEVLQESEIPVSVELIDGGAGFDLDGSSLTYGKLARGSSTTRSVTFTNEYDFDVEVHIEPYGEIRNFVVFDSPIKVRGTEIMSIPITLSSTLDDSLGDYSGYLKFRVIG